MPQQSSAPPPIAPYQYEMLWRFAFDGRLTAEEVADDHNRTVHHDWAKWTPQGAANRLRGLVSLGLVQRSHDGFWGLTDKGCAWMEVRG